jgi:hypothetical protein
MRIKRFADAPRWVRAIQERLLSRKAIKIMASCVSARRQLLNSCRSRHHSSPPALPHARIDRLQIKKRQADRIRTIGAALTRAGFVTLDDKARVLGLLRSTTWTILQGRHRESGLSAAVVRRMLASPTLPRSVRDAILAYVTDKLAGSFGHDRAKRRRFAARLLAA